jgi:hypothetical protein
MNDLGTGELEVHGTKLFIYFFIPEMRHAWRDCHSAPFNCAEQRIFFLPYIKILLMYHKLSRNIILNTV